MKKINNKGFTLIELLVVVAIIGILAAVGVTAYSGYTASAKAQSAKTNHATIAKYVAAETTRCELGAAAVMAEFLPCADAALRGANIVGEAVRLALDDFRNPFRTQARAIINGAALPCATGGANPTDETYTLGRTYIDNLRPGIVLITTCWQVADNTAQPPILEISMTNEFRVDGR